MCIQAEQNNKKKRIWKIYTTPECKFFISRFYWSAQHLKKIHKKENKLPLTPACPNDLYLAAAYISHFLFSQSRSLEHTTVKKNRRNKNRIQMGK
jgi:hypothetical protein